MTEDSRRKWLKGLAITLPVAWTRPVVETIVLPAHAQTSPACSAAADCYEIAGEGDSFQWSGGAGPQLTPFFLSTDSCDGTSVQSTTLVVAENAEQAAAIFSTEVEGVEEITTEPLLGSCAFFRQIPF